MRSTLEKKPTREAVKRRQVEIEQCLTEYGLAGNRRCSPPDARGEDSQCRRLSAALVSLGPVFSSFGIYLASRTDLFTPKNCLQLAAIPDRAEPTATDLVREAVSREIGCSTSDVFSIFEEEPFETRLMFQSHRAWLSDDEAVTVKVVRPEFEEQLACDAQLLPLLTSALAGEAWAVDSTIPDFIRTLRQQLNLLHEADGMETVAYHTVEFRSLKVPAVYRDLSASKVLTIERLPGLTLDYLISSFDEGGQAELRAARMPTAVDGVDLHELAIQLCLVWLRLALQGQLFPVDPRAENVLVLSSSRIAFTGGVFGSLPSESQTNLLDYLVAASIPDVDRACSCLIQEMSKTSAAVSEDNLRHRMRQLVPFRDGGWSDSGGDSLAEHLFLHWRLASGQGYPPRLHSLFFFRGLFWIANAARRLNSGQDALLAALEELRMGAAMSQFKQLLNLSQLTDSTEKYATMMTELPRKLDQALTLMAEGNAILKLEGLRKDGRNSRQNSSAVLIALLLALGALVLLAHRLSSVIAPEWIDRISALAFILLGAMVLRAASRTR
jgi:predicted unusual protein kinase regulating ubiquinone biosynthesis (AarF/ABC1/UbiB family)